MSLLFTILWHSFSFPLKPPDGVVVVFSDEHFVGSGFEVEVAGSLERTLDSFDRTSSVAAEYFDVWWTPVRNQQISVNVEVHAIRSALVIASKSLSHWEAQIARISPNTQLEHDCVRYLALLPKHVCFRFRHSVWYQSPIAFSISFQLRSAVSVAHFSSAEQQSRWETNIQLKPASFLRWMCNNTQIRTAPKKLDT